MKLKMYLALLAMGMIGLQSCSDDDDGLPNSKVPEAVRTAFEETFSNASNLKWETENVAQGQYYKAEFYNKNDNGYKTEVWYTPDGKWYMTETEMPYNAIPQAIRTSFESSEYANWRRDNEVDRIERAGVTKEVIYIIEVESAQDVDLDLIYSEDGILIKAIGDNGDGNNGSYLPNVPSDMVTAATEFINTKYPNARIIEIDMERGLIEIDIIHDNRAKEVLLNSTYEWIQTSWEVNRYSLPARVTEAINASQYAGYAIDDADYIETPTGDYYLIEFERGDRDYYLKITAEGQIIA